MTLPGSLRFRLLAGAAVWIALALTLAGVALSGLFRSHVMARFTAELVTHLDQLAAGLEVAADGRVVLARPLSDPRFNRPLSGLYWQVGPGDGAPLRSRSLWDGVLALPVDDLADGELHQHSLPSPFAPVAATTGSGPAAPAADRPSPGRAPRPHQPLVAVERLLSLPERTAPVRIVVAADSGDVVPVMAAFNRTLALSLAVLAAALIAAAGIQVAVGLQPLARLRRDLAAVRDGRSRRLPADIPSEVRPLADDLNGLLDHNEAAVARARIQAGNLAHALKTDLAVLANEARDLPTAAAGRLSRQVDRMARALDHHMARARAAAAHRVPGMRTPVAPAARGLIRALSRLHADRAVTLTSDIAPDAIFAGEQQDLEEMLGNLLDNACKWAGQRVSLSATASGARLIITVADDGPGLPAARREAVLAPGVRLDETVPGSGLGLAVVNDLADLYGGWLRLSDTPGGGLTATLELPAAL